MHHVWKEDGEAFPTPAPTILRTPEVSLAAHPGAQESNISCFTPHELRLNQSKNNNQSICSFLFLCQNVSGICDIYTSETYCKFLCCYFQLMSYNKNN